MAALSVVFDSPLGLPAEAASPQVGELRRGGRRPCELAGLVSVDSESTRGTPALWQLFRLAYLTARRLERATDFVIAVHPRHAPFYRRVMLFEPLGGPAGAVPAAAAPPGALSVLLRLDLESAEDRYAARYGTAADSFLRLFVDPRTEAETLDFLRRGRRPLDEAAVRRLFLERRPLLRQAPRSARRHLEACYPGL